MVNIRKANEDELKTIQCVNEMSISAYYPDFTRWFDENVKPNIGNGREILVAVDENDGLLGCSILKIDDREKKICTLRVDADYRHQGIGTALVKESLDILGHYDVHITVPQETVDEFVPLLSSFGFSLKTVVDGAYRPGVDEYCFSTGR